MEDLQKSLKQIAENYLSYDWFCAVSGGPDSLCLLYLLRELYPEKSIEVLYFNHQWSEKSALWLKATEQQAQALQCKFSSYTLEKKDGLDTEGDAHFKRHEIYQKLLEKPAALFLGHHLDDLIETSLWRWLRGNWQQIYGLEKAKPYAQGFLLRPLLFHEKNELIAYLEDRQIKYHLDSSNEDTRHLRNFLRHKIIPSLQTRKEFHKKTLIQAQKNQLQEQRALTKLLKPYRTDLIAHWKLLPNLDTDLLVVFIKSWLKELQESFPSQKQLECFVEQCLENSNDKTPLLELKSKVVISYQGKFYLENKHTWLASKTRKIKQLEQIINCLDPFEICWANQTYIVDLKKYHSQQFLSFPLKITLRSGTKHDKISDPEKEIIKLYDVWRKEQIPPWKRHEIPLVFLDEVCLGYACCLSGQSLLDSCIAKKTS